MKKNGRLNNEELIFIIMSLLSFTVIYLWTVAK
jgi:hypothetical protein